MYNGRSVVTLSWVAPWAPGILKVPASRIRAFFELDASFRALKPYVSIVPTLVVANYGIPLGIVVTPTERAASYRLFWANLDEGDIERDVSSRPLLSDQGKALRTYGREHCKHWFCYRHMLERLGSGTYVAILAHRLMFCASKTEYDRNREDVAAALDIGTSSKRITGKGKRIFCRTFGFTKCASGWSVTLNPDPVEAQALWSERGRAGVSACTNHVEGLHGRLNKATAEVRLISRRLKCMVEVLWQKANRFSADAHRSAKRKYAEMIAIAKAHGYERAECDCGWNIVYEQRFGIDGFPCIHTCQEHPVDFRLQNPPNLEFSFDQTSRPLVHSAYCGTEWNLAQISAGAQRRGETREHLPIDEEAVEEKLEADVDGFVRRIISELKMLNPQRASELKVGNVAAEYGAFVGEQQQFTVADIQNPHLRAQFEIRFFGSDLKQK
jgi:hypothetical protein